MSKTKTGKQNTNSIFATLKGFFKLILAFAAFIVLLIAIAAIVHFIFS